MSTHGKSVYLRPTSYTVSSSYLTLTSGTPENMFDVMTTTDALWTNSGSSRQSLRFYGFSLPDIPDSASNLMVNIRAKIFYDCSGGTSYQEGTLENGFRAYNRSTSETLGTSSITAERVYTVEIPLQPTVELFRSFQDDLGVELVVGPRTGGSYTKGCSMNVYDIGVEVAYAANINKVVVNRNGTPETLIDLTEDTVTPATLVQGYTAHDASGRTITGVLVPEETVVEALAVTPTTSQQVFQPSAAASRKEQGRVS